MRRGVFEYMIGIGMKKIGKSHWNGEQHSYWQSYSDMMAALLIIFILVIAITMGIYKQKNAELDVATLQLNKAWSDLEISKEKLKLSKAELEGLNEYATMTAEELKLAYAELNKAKAEIEDANEQLRVTRSDLQDIVGIRTDIITSLQQKFSNSSMEVNPQTGSISFSADVLFKTGSYVLSDESRNILKEAVPMYLGVLMQDEYKDYIAEIIIEGHTDTKGSYENNMNLSYNRAHAVAGFCLDEKNGLTKEQIDSLRKVLTVNGRSYMDPVYVEGTDEVDMDASRRVEIKFRLKENEMIEKINEVLSREAN